MAILVFSCLIFGKSDIKERVRLEGSVEKKHYFFELHYEKEDSKKIDRKRSHKRRRKIRKPVKGLR
tara:strand:+ start:342 stop:539 length:198 start_codon:yes stop_codon:yes gene_type:complete